MTGGNEGRPCVAVRDAKEAEFVIRLYPSHLRAYTRHIGCLSPSHLGATEGASSKRQT
ncbi:hypothetical protein [Hyella patelloides]|uniref:hypothetical protein n=1 Tax=Hyella patelloides TaxID=1982969 RepID=UPI001643829E|nr:hypothetical protein [Hyella patelloides]